MSGTPLIVLSTYICPPCFLFSILHSKFSRFFADQNTRRESGRKVQLGNVEAAKVSEN